MPLGRTNRDLNINAFGVDIVIPRETYVALIRGASGTEGDLWAVWSAKLLIRLTGNAHDPVYRYVFVPKDAVTEQE